MACVDAEKCNVAWFKLAEFVGRKEKERAMVLYKLLVHSWSDGAFIAQLEGDLLFAFKNEKAVDSYKKAMFYYEESGRYVQAAFLCERLIGMVSEAEVSSLIIKLLRWYVALGCEQKVIHCMKLYADLICQYSAMADISDILQNIDNVFPHRGVEAYEVIFNGLMRNKKLEYSLAKTCLNRIVTDQQNQQQLPHFFVQLLSADASLYAYAMKLSNMTL